MTYSLTVLLELFQQLQDRPRSLRVKTGSRLIEEEEELGLGSKSRTVSRAQRQSLDSLNTNSKTLALFDVETGSGNTNDGIGIRFHVQKLDDLVDVRKLFSLGDGTRLAKNRAEREGLADGRSRQVKILLLDVTWERIRMGYPPTDVTYQSCAGKSRHAGYRLQASCQ